MGGMTMGKITRLEELKDLLLELERRLYKVEEQTREQALQYTVNMYNIHEREEHQKPTEEEKLLATMEKVYNSVNTTVSVLEKEVVTDNGELQINDRPIKYILYDVLDILNKMYDYLHRQKI